MSEKSDSINPRMSLEEIAASWQARALRLTTVVSPKLCRVLMSMFVDNYGEETALYLFHMSFPGYRGVLAPMLSSNPKIDKVGRIVADLIDRDGAKIKNYVIFNHERQMEGKFRSLADQMRMTDAERIDLFICVRHWVKADQRLDPTFDRRDPEARRLVLH